MHNSTEKWCRFLFWSDRFTNWNKAPKHRNYCFLKPYWSDDDSSISMQGFFTQSCGHTLQWGATAGRKDGVYCSRAGLAAGPGAGRLTLVLRQPYPWMGFLNNCNRIKRYNLQLFCDHIFMYANAGDLLTGTLDCFPHDHHGPSGMKFSKVLEISCWRVSKSNMRCWRIESDWTWPTYISDVIHV